jgi:hypothetical protein
VNCQRGVDLPVLSIQGTGVDKGGITGTNNPIIIMNMAKDMVACSWKGVVKFLFKILPIIFQFEFFFSIMLRQIQHSVLVYYFCRSKSIGLTLQRHPEPARQCHSGGFIPGSNVMEKQI